MRNVIIVISILFSSLLNSQVQLNNKSIDSIITKHSCNCFDFNFDIKASRVMFSEVTKEEGVIPTKMSISANDNNQFNEIMYSGGKQYAYLISYNYKFTIDGYVFYTSNFRYDTSQYDLSMIKTQIENINSNCLKIKKGKFISPQKAENIAKQNGFNNITYQSLDDQYYGTENHYIKVVKKYVWIFKEEGKRTKTLVINAKNGKILSESNQ